MGRGRHSAAPPLDAGRGWTVAIAGCLINTWTFGVFYSFATALEQMTEEFDATLSGIATFFGVTTFLFFALGIVAGPLADRFGARPLVLLGGLFMGGGLWLTAQTTSLGIATVTYGIGVGIGIGAYLVPMNIAVGGWFERQRTLAMGVNTVGIGLGTLILVPVANRIIEDEGWRQAFELMGYGSAIVFTAVALVAFRPPVPGAGFAASRKAAKEATAKTVFWRLYFAGLFMSLALFVPFVFLVDYAKDQGISSGRAALLISALGVGSVVGRLGLGVLGIRVGVMQLVVMCFAIQPVSYAIWLVAGASYPLLLFFALLLGVGYGGYVALSPVAAAAVFGMYGLGGVLGVLYTSAGLGALFGPVAAGAIIDATGNYTAAIGISIVVSAIATLIAVPLWDRAPTTQTVEVSRHDGPLVFTVHPIALPSTTTVLDFANGSREPRTATDILLGG